MVSRAICALTTALNSSRPPCLRWRTDSGIDTAYITPGKPWQNGVDERVKGNFRDECLHTECFRLRAEGGLVIETCRRHYNEVRPHSSLG